MRVINHRQRQARVHKARVNAVGRVDKNHRRFRIQMPPYGVEVGVAEVVVASAVAGEEGDSVCFQHIEASVDFGDDGGGGVGEERGHGGEEAVLAGVGVADEGCGVVGFLGKG